MADVNRGNRLLSPHLTIYKPQLTSMTLDPDADHRQRAHRPAHCLTVWWFLAAGPLGKFLRHGRRDHDLR